MKELVIITASPNGLRFSWEHYIYLNNLREKGLSDRAQILVFTPLEDMVKGPHIMWRQLETDFPETKFFYYPDEHGTINRIISVFGYIPILRIFCLIKHFEKFPELKDKAIFYTDSDILLTDDFDFTPFLSDDVCYLSEANSYTNADYFLSKYNLLEDGTPEFAKPEKYVELKRRDILQDLARTAEITKDKILEHNTKSGAAQYLLKNIDHIFWNNVFDTCLSIYTLLGDYNRQYMQSEDKGYQKWCSDIWAVQFSLYRRNYPVETPKYFDFTWATDDISRLKEARIYHNAGITSDSKLKRKIDKQDVECPAFFKGKASYRDNIASPFDNEEQPYIDSIINNPISQTFANCWYAEEIKKVKTLYNL